MGWFDIEARGVERVGGGAVEAFKDTFGTRFMSQTGSANLDCGYLRPIWSKSFNDWISDHDLIDSTLWWG